ncbi:MAG: universal stress protein [Thermodesulfobacteriota bacterium]
MTMKVQLNTIICTTDFSDLANQAVPYALALAQEYKAKLYVCHVIDLPAAAMYGEALVDPQEIQLQIENYAQEQVGRMVGQRPVDWEPLITVGHPAEEIARLAGEKKVGLVIAATHGRSGLQRLILGSVTERLMRTLPCPLLVSPDPAAGLKKEVRFRRLLVGCDFSQDSDLAVEYGLHLAQEFQAELHLAHVIEPTLLKDMLRPGSAPDTEIRQGLRDRLNEDLAGLIPEEAHNWCDCKTSLLAGQPHEELTKYAVIHDVDLIVLGVHGRGFVELLLVGSTTDRVIRMAPCPVLAVRPMESETG